MEGIKKNEAGAATILPQAEGWAIWRGSKREHIAASLAEAAALLPSRLPVHLALPVQGLVIERSQLPATQPDELAGMVRLQWEKTLPFPPEDVSGDFAVITQEPKESTVLAVAASRPALEKLCQPLRERAATVTRLSPFVCHVAAACPADQTVLAVYVELGQIVLAIVENRCAGWVHLFPSCDAARFSAELPQLLLTASLEGVPVVFAEVLVAPEAEACETALREHCPAPIAPLPLIAPSSDAAMDLLPPAWRLQEEQSRTWRRTARRLRVAAAVYLLVVMAGMGHLFLLRRQSRQVETQLAALRPQLVQIQERQSRSLALAPAIDPHRYTVEMLYLIHHCLPGAEVRLTEFDQTLPQWRIVGEAPTAALAVHYVARLKDDPELKDCQISAGPPQLVAGERAQFSIFGKP